MAASSARNSANSRRALAASSAVFKAPYVFCKLSFVATDGLVAATGTAEVIGDELEFVAADIAATDGVCPALRCHSHAPSAARMNTLATAIKIPFEFFLCGDMASVFVRLIDSKPQVFRKTHSTFKTRH